MTVFVVAPLKFDSRYAAWLRLLSVAATTSCFAVPKDEGRECTIILDEAGNMGRVDPLAKGVTSLREYGVSVWFLFQDEGQLEMIYDRALAGTIKGNATLQYFNLTNVETAKRLSEAIGPTTVMVEGRNTSGTVGMGYSYATGTSTQDGNNWGSSGSGSSRGWSDGTSTTTNENWSLNISDTEGRTWTPQARPLLHPNEVLAHLARHTLVLLQADGRWYSTKLYRWFENGLMHGVVDRLPRGPRDPDVYAPAYVAPLGTRRLAGVEGAIETHLRNEFESRRGTLLRVRRSVGWVSTGAVSAAFAAICVLLVLALLAGEQVMAEGGNEARLRSALSDLSGRFVVVCLVLLVLIGVMARWVWQHEFDDRFAVSPTPLPVVRGTTLAHDGDGYWDVVSRDGKAVLRDDETRERMRALVMQERTRALVLIGVAGVLVMAVMVAGVWGLRL
ncbi:MAG: hypothetical protein EBR88_01355 [Betaproteobacteria bacterium]|nr:hypothetical protein [Betaproteobacteria bacterium]